MDRGEATNVEGDVVPFPRAITSNRGKLGVSTGKRNIERIWVSRRVGMNVRIKGKEVLVSGR